MSKEKSSSNGIGILGVLFFIFLTLKLGGFGMVANWSWWWVTAPLWIPISVVFVFTFFYYLIKAIIQKF